MVGDLFRGQEYAEQILDLTQADTRSECGNDQFSQFGLVEENPPFGLTFQSRNHLVQTLILREQFAHDFRGGLAVEPLLDLAGVLIDGLAATAGQFGLLSDGSVPTRKDGGGVENPDARR
jgi:hypothetical protein